jgi:hypothetical protein
VLEEQVVKWKCRGMGGLKYDYMKAWKCGSIEVWREVWRVEL